MSQWLQLPTELKQKIFQFLADDPGGNPRKLASCRNKKAGLACFASVSTEWQHFFEQRLYSHLTVTQYCLDDFDQLIHRQRGIIRHVWLRFRLSSYSCLTCRSHRSEPGQKYDMGKISNAIARLFQILSKWRFDGTGTTLEISTYCASDTEHFFRGNIYLDTNLDEVEKSDGLPHDPAHGWLNGRLSKLLTYNIINKSRCCSFKGYQRPVCPVVQVITNLMFRRTSRQDISLSIIEAILEKLPNLHHFHYEIWREWSRHPSGYIWDRCKYSSSKIPSNANIMVNIVHQRIISEFLPVLKTITFFEDFNEDFNRASTLVHFSGWPLAELIRTPSTNASAALACKSLSLEKVSSSYFTDAVPFFKAAISSWIWDSLTSLSLTCQLFLDSSNSTSIVVLLGNIGSVSQRMPKLQLLDIWYGMKRHACAFKYRLMNNRAIIGWCGIWELVIAEESILSTWQDFARLRTSNDILVDAYQKLNSEAITSHAAAIRLLGVGEHVIHPASLEEINRESRFYFSP
jgi:hypothetical protein